VPRPMLRDRDLVRGRVLPQKTARAKTTNPRCAAKPSCIA
jgi:hypothetical protein